MSNRSTTLALPSSFDLDDDGYPHSDGQPLAESNPHAFSLVGLWEALRDLFDSRTDEVSVHMDMFWYWERNNREAVLTPDLMVIFGVAYEYFRLSYKGWEHGSIAPGIIIETASQKQAGKLLGELRDTYEELGVHEYFAFDWSGAYLDLPLYGFRLEEGRYQPIPTLEDGSMESRQLGVLLRPAGERLELVDPLTGQTILTNAEARLRQSQDALAAAKAEADAKDGVIAVKDEMFAAAKAETEAQESRLAKLEELLRQAGITPPEMP